MKRSILIPLRDNDDKEEHDLNIFALSECPIESAQWLCDKHIPKLIVECFQMLGSAQRRHGAKDAEMPLTSKGTPLKGGYHHHPATRWTGDTRENYWWLVQHAMQLLYEYQFRFRKKHACTKGIIHLALMQDRIPEGDMTTFAQCMPDEWKHKHPVLAYRNYYAVEKAHFARWERGRPAPAWFLSRRELIPREGTGWLKYIQYAPRNPALCAY